MRQRNKARKLERRISQWCDQNRDRIHAMIGDAPATTDPGIPVAFCEKCGRFLPCPDGKLCRGCGKAVAP